jgi:ketosteroid isomerase-like protein
VTEEHVQTIRRVYDAIRRRDVDAVVQEMDPGMEGTARVMAADGSVFRGHDGMRRFLDEILRVFPDWAPEVATVTAHGDGLLVELRVRAQGAGSGVPLVETAWQAVRFLDGRIVSWSGYATEAEAREDLESAG